MQLDAFFGDRSFDGSGICLGFLQKSVVLFKTNSGGLFFELRVHNALAQRFEFAFDAKPVFIAGAQARGQIVIGRSFGCQQVFAL